MTEEEARDLALFIDNYITRKYGRLLQGFFRATIVTVAGAASNYQATVSRLDETAADGNLYQVAPTYVGTPTVGDKVECMWRDDKTGYVLWKAANG